MTGSTSAPSTDAAAAGAPTLRELVAVPSLGLRVLAAPDRIDVPIRWAHPTELVDPGPYLSGGELVLTLGASLQGDATRCRAFVARLVDSGACALGYGVGDVTPEVPGELVQACRDAALPLLRVPAGVPFQEITELLADHRAEARAAGERRVQQLSTRLLDAMAEDRTLDELLDIVAAELGGSLDYTAGRLSWAPAADSDVPPPESTLRHVGSVLAVRQHEQAVAFAQQLAENGRLLRLVAEGKADAEVLRDSLGGGDVALEGMVVVAVWPQKAVPLVQEALGEALFADVAGITEGAEGCVSITTDPDRVLAAAVEYAVPCGVAAPCALVEAASAVPAALAALDLSRRRGTPVTHRDLLSLDGLLEQQPHERVRPFAETLVLPLVRHDQEHGTGLLPTLRAFLTGDGSVNATANDLHLHPNSLRHRLRRIAELTGADPRVFADRVALAIGLWAWDRRPRGRR